jgi:hypothetical protein
MSVALQEFLVSIRVDWRGQPESAKVFIPDVARVLIHYPKHLAAICTTIDLMLLA